MQRNNCSSDPQFLYQLRNASELIGIGGPKSDAANQAYQCDFGPVVGTSVIVEVELSETDDDEEMDEIKKEEDDNIF